MSEINSTLCVRFGTKVIEIDTMSLSDSTYERALTLGLQAMLEAIEPTEDIGAILAAMERIYKSPISPKARKVKP